MALLVSTLAVANNLADDADEKENSTLPRVEVLATDPSALEGTSSGAFTLIRSGNPTNSLEVHYTLSGTATNGVDYVQVKDVTTIPVGLLAADILINPIVNARNPGNKKVILTLATNANYRLKGHKSARVTIVDDNFDDQPPVVSLLSPTNGSVFAFSAPITLLAQASDPDDTIKSVSFFADDDLLGRVATSPFMLVWTNARPGKYALFARATDASEKSTLSSAVHITVTKPDANTNPPPKVSVITPTNSTVFGLPANVKIEASATSPNSSIAKVQVYGDHRFLGSFTNPPYSLTWTNVAPGKHLVTVRATDSTGATAAATSMFTVTNAPPVVSITSPTDGATFAAKSDLTVKATATDSDGTIASVSFYADRRFLGRVTKSPYELTWKNVSAGSHKITAVARDNFGAEATSKSVSISVSR